MAVALGVGPDHGGDDSLVAQLGHTARHLVLRESRARADLVARHDAYPAVGKDGMTERRHDRPAVPADLPLYEDAHEGVGQDREALLGVQGEGAFLPRPT